MKALRLPSLPYVRITLLAENTAVGRGILGEHGLSWLIEAGGRRVLFDLGQGMVLARNAAAIGVDLADVEAIVLSHGHYDHVDGWTVLPEAVKKVPVYLHPAALEEKFQGKGGGRMERVNDPAVLRAIGSEALARRSSEGPVEVVEGLWATGEVPRETGYEDTGGAFFLDQDGTRVDPLADDQSLFFRTEAGLVVVLGCAHAGVVNTLRHVRRLCPDRPLHAVVGGMHLVNAGGERLERTIADLRDLAPDWLGPNHCTGEAAVAALTAAFPGRILSCHAGRTLTFPVPPDCGRRH
jgi:7,8-dihydropterin-6-yl-methyl-4-(beta-D-ribofuranosyl)aminobenzene 5'-phosphate synthase